jgi:DNA invertase Pin-like site-specific DNA recombinase
MPGDKGTRAIGYTIDLKAGYYRYVNIEGVGECRENFMKLVNDLDKGKADTVIVPGAQLLFVDTSPMWMEKFIATVKQRGVLIVDAVTSQEYDLSQSADEVAFRALENQKPGA